MLLAALQVKLLHASVCILILINKSATDCLANNGTAPPRLSLFAKASAASNTARMMPTLMAPTITAVRSKHPDAIAAPVPGVHKTFLAGTLRLVYLICGPEQAVCPGVDG